MSDKPARELTFSAIFCDDIRDEVGGKVTLVGVFSTHLLTPAFPIFIPRLGVFVRSAIPRGQEGIARIRIEKNEAILLEAEFPATPDQNAEAWPTGVDSPSCTVVDAKMVLSPLQFDGPCTLRVVLTLNGKSYVAGKLHVSVLSEEAKQKLQVQN